MGLNVQYDYFCSWPRDRVTERSPRKHPNGPRFLVTRNKPRERYRIMSKDPRARTFQPVLRLKSISSVRSFDVPPEEGTFGRCSNQLLTKQNWLFQKAPQAEAAWIYHFNRCSCLPVLWRPSPCGMPRSSSRQAQCRPSHLFHALPWLVARCALQRCMRI
jgi:hypothetical protein